MDLFKNSKKHFQPFNRNH